MGYKYVKIDENGKKVTSHQFEEGAVSYATQKIKDSVLGNLVYRTISYSKKQGGKGNSFDIHQRHGRFVVSWKNVYVAPRPSQPKDGVIVLDYRADMMLDIKIGEFEKLQDAELYAIKFALDFGDVAHYFGYHPLFEKEGITIEDIPNVFTWEQVARPIQISCPKVNKKAIEKNIGETKRRLELREKIKNGGEDTRIMVKVLLNVDLGDLGQAISDKLLEEVSTVDGVGANGDSVYNVDDVVVDVKNTGEVEATFYLERESGKFTSADELRENIVNSIRSIDVELPITVTE